MDAIGVSELNHAVLYVRNVAAAAAFYREVLGFEVVSADPHGRATFLRAGGSRNHHDLGLISVGAGAPRPPRGATGLYHLAWRVDSIEELARAREVLVAHGVFSGQSDHGVSKSLYAADPDGNEFEIMYLLDEDAWPPDEDSTVVAPLDLAAEVARHRD